MSAILLSDALRLKGVKGRLSSNSVYMLLRKDKSLVARKGRRIEALDHVALDRKIDILLGRKTLEDWIVSLATNPIRPFDEKEIQPAYRALAARVYITENRQVSADDVQRFWGEIDSRALRLTSHPDDLPQRVAEYANGLLPRNS